MREREFQKFLTKLKYLISESDNRMSSDILDHLRTWKCNQCIEELVDVKRLSRLWGED